MKFATHLEEGDVVMGATDVEVEAKAVDTDVRAKAAGAAADRDAVAEEAEGTKHLSIGPSRQLLLTTRKLLRKSPRQRCRLRLLSQRGVPTKEDKPGISFKIKKRLALACQQEWMLIAL